MPTPPPRRRGASAGRGGSGGEEMRRSCPPSSPHLLTEGRLLHRLYLFFPVAGQAAPRVRPRVVGDVTVADSFVPCLENAFLHLGGRGGRVEQGAEAVRRVIFRPRGGTIRAETFGHFDQADNVRSGPRD